ncbi:MAG: ATP-binding protein [Anaerolineaceae bacterium]|jgi:SpoVK/Ycf46/Vps4 family AAA+-type ATPase|nr:ATP-binding protein [Anaerolineaceae bacterium]
MPRLGFRKRTSIHEAVEPLSLLWILRMLVPLGAHRDFITRHGFSNDALAECLGLGHWVELQDQEFDPRLVLVELRSLLLTTEKTMTDARVPPPLRDNLARLAELVGLSETDCRVLEFAVLIHTESMLDEVADSLGQLTSAKTCAVLAVLLDLPEEDVRRTLASGAALPRSGLLSLDKDGSSTLSQKLQVLSRGFADSLTLTEDDPLELIRDAVRLSCAPHLSLDNYPHLARELGVLRPYLDNALAQKRPGVNIFIHGNPGTGKSQLVRALARAYQCQLFEVACEDSDGDAITGNKRLRAFRVAQSFLARRRAMVLFDEVEDVFDDGDGVWSGKSTAQKNKAWINRMLEENPVPTFWLSNSAEALDPAFIRRFDMIIQVPVPPRSQRRALLRQHCGDLLSEALVDRIATSEALVPAVISRAASVVSNIRQQVGDHCAGAAFELLVNNTLETQGYARIGREGTQLPSGAYDLSLINTDQDLTTIAVGLKDTASARLCIYGPPGTGKTAWGRWLAESLDRPLLVKRGSDLLSMWIGGTEKNLAAAFREAESEGAVLLIDEVDSFLQDRRHARHSWEITAVNEMLTCMETFEGLFIATTNLVDGLDQAALRRFDLKLHFGYLAPSQTENMLRQYCHLLSLPEPDASDLACVRCLRNLTPGDFAVILRQSRFRRFTRAFELVSHLQADCEMKDTGTRAIGFVH